MSKELKKSNLKNFDRDDEGIIYKHPERTCKECINYPCFRGIENFVCDFAKYGCRKFKDINYKS